MARSMELYTAFVGNLACNITRAQLLEVFEPYGNLHSVYIRVPEPLATHTFGFVRFTSPESRDAAVEAQNGLLLLGHHVSVQKSRQTAAPPPPRPVNPGGEVVKVEVGRRNVRDRVEESGAVGVSKPEAAVDTSCQMHRLQQVKDSYAKILTTKYGVHGTVAESMVADFIEQLNRISYDIVDVDVDPATSMTTRLDTGLVQAQLSMLKQHEGQPQPAGGAGSGRHEQVPGVAEPPTRPPSQTLLLTPSLTTLTASQEQPPSCQQQQQVSPAVPPPLSPDEASSTTAGCDGRGVSAWLGPSGSSAAAAFRLPLATRMDPLCASSASLEPRGRGKASLEFLEECTGRGRLHTKV